MRFFIFIFSFIIVSFAYLSKNDWQFNHFRSKNRSPASIETPSCSDTLKKLGSRPKIYFSDARIGQKISHKLLGELLQNEVSSLDVVQMTELDLRGLKPEPGATYVINIYSELWHKIVGETSDGKVGFLDEAKKVGAKIYLELENTKSSIEPFWIQQYWGRTLGMMSHQGIELLVFTDETESLMKQFVHKEKIHRLGHIEHLFYQYSFSKKNTLSEMVSEMDQWGDKIRLLFIEQYDEGGEKSLRQFLDSLKENKSDVGLVIALHPYSLLSKYEQLKKQYPKLDFILFQSGADLKTNQLIPYVDGVVSEASTLGDLSEQTGVVPLYRPLKQGKDQFKDFMEKLHIRGRKLREEFLKNKSQQTLIEWINLIFRAP